ncbi:unnamed protein product [Callosobruchus maculatus]|uniref:DUF4485 domain-containing protein n=1 Tax=Callosobruchus maculatus TaxID=64391 RepID=A0A653CH07_CALMS|nr:unnamed protein product [Callosobruchus maculatus]
MKCNPIKALNDHFLYNHRLAKALQQLLSPQDRKMLQVWFDKLMAMDKTPEEMVIRSDYMWFVLLMLQSKRIWEPFNKLPPPQLLPLKKFVPLHVYENVLIANEPNMNNLSRSRTMLSKSVDVGIADEDVSCSTSCSSLRY